MRRLVDILDTADTESGVIAFVCRQTEDLRERCYTFQLLTETNVSYFFSYVKKFILTNMCLIFFWRIENEILKLIILYDF